MPTPECPHRVITPRRKGSFRCENPVLASRGQLGADQNSRKVRAGEWKLVVKQEVGRV